MIDFKISTIRRDANVTVTVRIYQGAITTEDEKDITRAMVPVTRYRRTSKVREHTITFPNATDEQILKLLRKKLKRMAVKRKDVTIPEQSDAMDTPLPDDLPDNVETF